MWGLPVPTSWRAATEPDLLTKVPEQFYTCKVCAPSPTPLLNQRRRCESKDKQVAPVMNADLRKIIH